MLRAPHITIVMSFCGISTRKYGLALSHWSPWAPWVSKWRYRSWCSPNSAARLMRCRPFEHTLYLLAVLLLQVRCCAAPAPSGPPPEGSHNRLGLSRDLQLPATTAVSAYAKAAPLPHTVRDSGLIPAVASPKPQARPASQPRTPLAKLAGQQQVLQHVLHNETAYTFVAPNWEPLIGRSRQHQRVEKEVSALCCVACNSHLPGMRHGCRLALCLSLAGLPVLNKAHCCTGTTPSSLAC